MNLNFYSQKLKYYSLNRLSEILDSDFRSGSKIRTRKDGNRFVFMDDLSSWARSIQKNGAKIITVAGTGTIAVDSSDDSDDFIKENLKRDMDRWTPRK